MTDSADPALAGIAAKAATESAYHLRHAAEWTIRLGDGTAESQRRAQDALDSLWILTGEMFEADAAERTMIEARIAIDPATLRAPWQATITSVLDEATLAPPEVSRMPIGGRAGRHGEALGHLLAELQFLQRTYPGCTW
jgi:ring-1,2-phenylacetyl-CoA epoxidase subunit PaaC